MGKYTAPPESKTKKSLTVMPNRTPKIRLLSLIVLAVVCMALILFVWYKKSQQRSVNVCSDMILREAKPVLDPLKTAKLKPISEEITSLKDYDRDPNCLYVVLTYHINIEDLDRARADLGKLQKVYNPKRGFSTDLGYIVKDIEAFRADIAYRDQAAKERQNNVKTFPNSQ